MQLSKKENQAYQILNENNLIVFKIKDIRLLLNLNKERVYNLVKSLKKKGVIKKIGNSFVFNNSEDFVLSTNIHVPSYVSFWSALNYYGWSDQNPKEIFLATTKYKKSINSFKYITILKERFFGYTLIGEFPIANKEKAIIDSVLFPKYSGGMREINLCLKRGLNELSKEKLILYAVKMNSKVVIRRLGFLLENLGYKNIHGLKVNIGKGYELLDPSLKKKNLFNKKWLLDINW